MDMTEEMLTKRRSTAEKLKHDHIEFRGAETPGEENAVATSPRRFNYAVAARS
jgi:hypothetical protein